MEEQNKKDRESGKGEEGGRSVSWEPLAESGLQMLCPPEDSQLLSILDGVTQITVPLPPRCLPPTISAPQLHPQSERQSHAWHHPCHGRSISRSVTQTLCGLPAFPRFLPLSFLTSYLLHFWMPPPQPLCHSLFLSFNLLASALDQLGSGICLVLTSYRCADGAERARGLQGERADRGTFRGNSALAEHKHS